jgi:hypothetical protein
MLGYLCLYFLLGFICAFIQIFIRDASFALQVKILVGMGIVLIEEKSYISCFVLDMCHLVPVKVWYRLAYVLHDGYYD